MITDRMTMLTLVEDWMRPDPAVSPDLAEEFERLFVGPGPVPCPPYESYWREDAPFLLRHTLMGPCVGGLVDLYASLGLQVSRSSAELPDHIAVELEALAVASADDATADVAAALLHDHVAMWVPAFCSAVAEQTTQEHYRKLAEATTSWLAAAQV